MNQHNKRYQKAKIITLIGAFMNALLGVMKLIGGTLYHSHALIADGLHSLSDLLIDGMVIFASKFGSRDADTSHPYGHQRIETAATFLLSLILIVTGLAIAWDSINDILEHNLEHPKFLALIIALLSIIINESLFHLTHYVGKTIASPLIIANAWHHRSDAASSIIVLIGLIGSVLGILYLDAIAAILVGLMIIKMGWSYGWNSVKELVDTAANPSVITNIQSLITRINGVKKIHQLRTRTMGNDVYVDVHVLVSPMISVSEGHWIAQQVHYQLEQQVLEIKDVTVHIDPEDDEVECPSIHLPCRIQVEETVLYAWKHDFPTIEFWTLHYLEGQLRIDLVCKPNVGTSEHLRSRIEQDLKHHAFISQVRLLSLQDTIMNPLGSVIIDNRK